MPAILTDSAQTLRRAPVARAGLGSWTLRRVPALAPTICGALTPVTFALGVVLGDVVQPEAFSPRDDDISDLGALTASSPWLYNQLAANLTGLLVLGFAIGLWRLVPRESRLGRAGILGVAVVGLGLVLDGLLRLDCQGIDAACDNVSWHASAHKVESGVTATALLVSPLVLGLAFRRLPAWRGIWLPTVLAVPAGLATSALVSVLGSGAATRAGSFVWFLWVAFVALYADAPTRRRAPDTVRV